MQNTIRPSRPVVLITGAAGNLGRATAEKLSGAYTVVGIDRDMADYQLLDSCYRCDITDPGALRETLLVIGGEHGGAIDSVIHLAETDDLADADALSADVEATADLIRAVSALFTVEQLILPSTAAVLAAPKPGQLQTPYQDIDAQGLWPRAKLLQEAIGANTFPGKTVVLRLGHLYSTDSINDMVTRLGQRLAGLRLDDMLFGGVPMQAQPVVHVDDAARCIQRCVDQRRALPERTIFLVAEPDPVAFSDIFKRASERLVGASLPNVRTGWRKMLDQGRAMLGFDEPVRAMTTEVEVTDFELRSKLGWRPERTLSAHLDDLLDAPAEAIRAAVRS